MGFVVIPNFGLTWPAIISGLILAVLPLILLVRLKSNKVLPLGIFLVIACIASGIPHEQYNDEYKELYHSEGILGQIKVVDHPSYEITEDHRIGRALLVNNTLQTYVGHEENFEYSIWNWSHYFPTAASIFPRGSKVLLLGLGGGTIVKQLTRLGYEVDVVEIDKRVHEVSVEFFNLDPSVLVFIDDARHYIKKTKKRYDIVIFDTFLSESVPKHLLTKEGFEDAKRILNKGGMVMSNFYGYLSGQKGRAARSVYKTFEHSGFEVEVLATPGSEGSRNLIFLGSLEEKDFSIAKYKEPNYKEITNLYDYFIDKRFLNLDDAYILSDNKPRLSKLYNAAAREWKKSYNNYYQKYFTKKG